MASVQGDSSYLRKGRLSEDWDLYWLLPLLDLPELLKEDLPLLEEPLDRLCERGERSRKDLDDEDRLPFDEENDLRPFLKLDCR